MADEEFVHRGSRYAHKTIFVLIVKHFKFEMSKINKTFIDF